MTSTDDESVEVPVSIDKAGSRAMRIGSLESIDSEVRGT